MVTGGFRIVMAFPEPPSAVLEAWERLKVVERGDRDEMAATGDLDDLPRPWLPGDCADQLRECVWTWCDEVAEWINHGYTWRPTQMIPPCWPHHPHIAHELPVLAAQRWVAQDSRESLLLEEWHRHTLPMFLERMTKRLGDSTCHTGSHQEWPAESRHAMYSRDDLSEVRFDTIYADAHPAVPLDRRE